MSRIADWPRLFGHIITTTGWTKSEVEALNLREVNELLEYWSEHPPAHVLLAAMMRARPLRKGHYSSGGTARNHLANAVAGVGGKISSVTSREMATLLSSSKIG